MVYRIGQTAVTHTPRYGIQQRGRLLSQGIAAVGTDGRENLLA